MTYEQILKEFDEQFPAMDNYLDGGVKKDIKSFLKQSFIKYLQMELSSIGKMKKTNEEFGFCRHCKYHQGDIAHDETCGSYNQAISDQITHLQAQIKELEA